MGRRDGQAHDLPGRQEPLRVRRALRVRPRPLPRRVPAVARLRGRGPPHPALGPQGAGGHREQGGVARPLGPCDGRGRGRGRQRPVHRVDGQVHEDLGLANEAVHGHALRARVGRRLHGLARQVAPRDRRRGQDSAAVEGRQGDTLGVQQAHRFLRRGDRGGPGALFVRRPGRESPPLVARVEEASRLGLHRRRAGPLDLGVAGREARRRRVLRRRRRRAAMLALWPGRRRRRRGGGQGLAPDGGLAAPGGPRHHQRHRDWPQGDGRRLGQGAQARPLVLREKIQERALAGAALLPRDLSAARHAAAARSRHLP
mmetsp:Transcript_29860/g.86738  ORF Transcript_29860/g.86738 Transcript_29860/m.86738 type:complete len:314 (+) Transcript_29860:486-1427(+)